MAEDPWVIIDLLGAESNVRVSDEKLADEVLRLSRDRGPGWCIEVVVASLDLLEESEVVLVVERWGTRKQNEEDDADTPIIDAGVVGSLVEDLWRYVPRRTACRRG